MEPASSSQNNRAQSQIQPVPNGFFLVVVKLREIAVQGESRSG